MLDKNGDLVTTENMKGVYRMPPPIPALEFQRWISKLDY